LCGNRRLDDIGTARVRSNGLGLGLWLPHP
jgi:hypothetical protein